MRLFLIFFIISNLFSQTVLYFDGEIAMSYLEQQCDFGPRYPGSEGHQKVIDFYKNHFNKYSENLILFEDYVTLKKLY